MDNFDEKSTRELIAYLMQENVIMRTEIGALRALNAFMFLSLKQLGLSVTTEDIENIWKDLLNKVNEQVLVSHPFFEEEWRQRLKKALDDIPGLF